VAKDDPRARQKITERFYVTISDGYALIGVARKKAEQEALREPKKVHYSSEDFTIPPMAPLCEAALPLRFDDEFLKVAG